MNISKGFDKYWQEDLRNHLSDNISRNNKQNIEVFNTVVENNKNKSKSTKYIIPAATGTGKTQITGYHIAKTLDRGFKSLVVVERTDSADELRELILKLSDEQYHDNINTLHSKETSTSKSIDEARDSQVLIITHIKFIMILLEDVRGDIKYEFEDTPYEKLVSDRDLIIIDEAISTVEEISISKNRLYEIVSELKSLSTTIHKKEKERYLAEVEIIETIADDLTGHHDNPDLNTDIMPYKEQLNDVVSANEVLPLCLRTLSHNNSQRSYETINKLDLIFNSEVQYLFKKGSDIYINTTKEIIPKKSIAVLDATATINKVYSEYVKHNDNIKIIPKIECRIYDKVNIHTFTTATGNEGIVNKKDDICPALVKSILDNTSDEDKVLVVVHKDIENTLQSYLGNRSNIHINHWGNLTGTNIYNECNKVFVYGLFHKPISYYYNNFRLAGNKFNTSLLLDDMERVKINDIGKSDVASELIQAINRGIIRKVVDERGGCDSADVYITLPPDNSLIIDALQSQLPQATITNDWLLPKTLSAIDRKGNTQILIKVLDEFRNEGKLFVTRDEVRECIDDNDSYRDSFRTNLGKPSTKATLKIAGYELHKHKVKGGSRGRSKTVHGFRYTGE